MLAADQYHRGLADAPCCPSCDATPPYPTCLEDRDHYLLTCPRWDQERAELWHDMAQLDIRGLQLPCDVTTLLGGMAATRNRSQLEGIVRATAKFLAQTGRLRQQ